MYRHIVWLQEFDAVPNVDTSKVIAPHGLEFREHVNKQVPIFLVICECCNFFAPVHLGLSSFVVTDTYM